MMAAIPTLQGWEAHCKELRQIYHVLLDTNIPIFTLAGGYGFKPR